MDRIVGGKYKLGRKIGSGAFGEVYEATQIDTFERVAVKIEKGNIRNSSLMEEARIYTILQGKSGIPKILWSGTDGDDKILVLELLGPNLLSLQEKCGGRFTLRTILLLAIQMIGRIEYVHSKGFLHRDIKPENFVMGVGKQRNKVYIIDFGLAKSYLNPATNCHIPNRALKNMIGTPRYASWNAHCLNEPSRRDDLESLGYVLIYLLRGRLPWQGVRGPTNNDKYALIIAMKYTFLEYIMPIPTELVNYLAYCDRLKFDEKPDYDFLRQLFYDRYCFEDLCDPKALAGYTSDNCFDWTSFQYQKARMTSASPRIFRRAQLPLPALANPDVPMNHDASSQVQSESSATVHDSASGVGSSSRRIHTI